MCASGHMSAYAGTDKLRTLPLPDDLHHHVRTLASSEAVLKVQSDRRRALNSFSTAERHTERGFQTAW